MLPELSHRKAGPPEVALPPPTPPTARLRSVLQQTRHPIGNRVTAAHVGPH
jgi:hypothetical protein